MTDAEITAMLDLIGYVSERPSNDIRAFDAVKAAVECVTEALNEPANKSPREILMKAGKTVRGAELWLGWTKQAIEAAEQEIFGEEPATSPEGVRRQ